MIRTSPASWRMEPTCTWGEHLPWSVPRVSITLRNGTEAGRAWGQGRTISFTHLQSLELMYMQEDILAKQEAWSRVTSPNGMAQTGLISGTDLTVWGLTRSLLPWHKSAVIFMLPGALLLPDRRRSITSRNGMVQLGPLLDQERTAK